MRSGYHQLWVLIGDRATVYAHSPRVYAHSPSETLKAKCRTNFLKEDYFPKMMESATQGMRLESAESTKMQMTPDFDCKDSKEVDLGCQDQNQVDESSDKQRKLDEKTSPAAGQCVSSIRPGMVSKRTQNDTTVVSPAKQQASFAAVVVV